MVLRLTCPLVAVTYTRLVVLAPIPAPPTHTLDVPITSLEAAHTRTWTERETIHNLNELLVHTTARACRRVLVG